MGFPVTHLDTSLDPLRMAHLDIRGVVHPVYIRVEKSGDVTFLHFPVSQVINMTAMRHYIARHMEECVEPLKPKRTEYHGYLFALAAHVVSVVW